MAAQLGLVLLVVHLFQVEQSYAFPRLLPLLFGGFVIHALLPLAYRLPFFLFLSMATFGVIFQFPHSLGLIGIGLGLIGLCHLPIAFYARVGLVVTAGIVLAAIRIEWLPAGPWTSLPSLVLPIIGSIFMFRLALYLYDLRHEQKKATIWERLSYFFLLPNACFPLFPVIDYQMYRRSHYNGNAVDIYQKGVLWMCRGVMHLLLYRFIYYNLTLTPGEVQGLGELAQYMVTNYLLYLRISGQFHLIIGILCLFGFNLPETHHLYYLASGFNDYWRRINIYWKDFMMKLFYYPSFMRLRKLGMTTGMVLATLIVFAGTWILHSYQWFWLRGTFPLTGPDMLFWGILGGLVAINSVYEAKQGRKRTLGKKAWSFTAALKLSAKTVGMLVFITTLWSLWSSHTVGEWLSMVSSGGQSGAGAYAVLVATIAVLVGIGILLQYLSHRGIPLTLVGSNPSAGRARNFTVAVCMVLIALGLPEVHNRMGSETVAVVASLKEDRLSKRDENLMERGYYEGLLNSDKYTSALWRVHTSAPKDWENFRKTDIVRETGDVLEYEILPGHVGVFKEASFASNAYGMRDKVYTVEKPAGTYRMALLGASYEMGSGVEQPEVFETLVEERLNRDHAGEPHEQYEILNFAAGGYSVLHNAVLAERRVFDFQPDLFVFAVHTSERPRLMLHLTSLINSEIDPEYPYLREIFQESGVRAGMERGEIERRLDPYVNDIILWGMKEMVASSRKRGIVPVALYVPITPESTNLDAPKYEQMIEMCREAGFVVLSLVDAYGGRSPEELRIAPWDTHPNTLGHRLLAEGMYRALLENADALNLSGLSAAGTPASAALPTENTSLIP